MKVFVMDAINEDVSRKIAESYEVILPPLSRKLDWKKEADAIIVRTFPITKQDLKECTNLKIIAKHGVGVDNIDLIAAQENNIIVTNTPGANSNSVAEYVITLILSLFRNLPSYNNLVKQGKWHSLSTSFELHEKTIGLIGLGDIGSKVSRILKNGFNANILAYDPFTPDEQFKKLEVQKVNSISELLLACDVISLHVPLNEATKNMISLPELLKMKPTSILINVSRGGVVNEDDLYKALKEKIIFAAACDVFQQEPVEKNSPLLTLENFIASPHIGGSSIESLKRMGLGALKNIDAVFNNQIPPNQIV